MCNDPSLHASALILPRSGGPTASNDAARRDRGLDYCCCYDYCYLQSWMRDTAPPSGLRRLRMICCNTTFSAAVIGEKSEARDRPSAAHLEHTTWRSSSCYWSLDYGDGARAQARMLSIFFSIPRLCSCRLWCVPLGEDLGCCRGAFSPSSRSEIGQASGVLHCRYHGQRGCLMITW